MSTIATELPTAPSQVNTVELEGTIRLIEPTFKLPTKIDSILVSIEHLKMRRNGKSTHPWFWLQFFGTAAERFHREYSLGSTIWVRGWLDAHNYTLDKCEKPRRLTVVSVQQFAPRKLEGL